MNLIELYDIVGNISTGKINVNSYHKNDPYGAWNTKEVRYSSVCFYVDSVNDGENERTFNGTLYYGDRLTETADNAFSVQNDAVEILADIIQSLREEDGINDVDYDVNFTLFKQKFADYLGGAYCSVSISTPIDNCINYDD